MEKLDIEKIKALYEAEVKKSDKDHHTPTAGAMVGHILANLKIQELKLQQGEFYVLGKEASFLKETFKMYSDKESQWFKTIAHELVIEGEIVPTTLEEITNYGKISLKGADKYLPAEDMVKNLVADFSFQNLFITRAIALATKENKYHLQLALMELYGFNQEVLANLQAFLGKFPKEGLEEEDEDED